MTTIIRNNYLCYLLFFPQRNPPLPLLAEDALAAFREGRFREPTNKVKTPGDESFCQFLGRFFGVFLWGVSWVCFNFFVVFLWDFLFGVFWGAYVWSVFLGVFFSLVFFCGLPGFSFLGCFFVFFVWSAFGCVFLKFYFGGLLSGSFFVVFCIVNDFRVSFGMFLWAFFGLLFFLSVYSVVLLC